MTRIANRILNLADSQTLAMAELSRELKAKGIDIISLSIGEPDFNTPDAAKEAGKRAIDNNFSHYTPVSGYEDLKRAIAEKLQKENQLEYSSKEIIVSNGAKQSLANALLSLVNPGDEVIIPAPYWVSYLELVKLAEGIPVIVEGSYENDYKIQPEDLEAAISEKTVAILFNSPSNPTGSIYSQSEMIALAEVLYKHPQVFVISDEIYEHINFVGEHISMANFPGMKERTAVINGVSKGYAMTGWRIGYMAAPLWLTKACDKLQGQMTSGASSISQKAALAALQQCKEDSIRMNSIFEKRCQLVYERLVQIPGFEVKKPGGAFYLFPKIDSFFGKKYEKWHIQNDMDFSMFLLDQAHVGVVAGSAFGADQCIRISYATSEEELIEALNRIEQAVMKLQ